MIKDIESFGAQRKLHTFRSQRKRPFDHRRNVVDRTSPSRVSSNDPSVNKGAVLILFFATIAIGQTPDTATIVGTETVMTVERVCLIFWTNNANRERTGVLVLTTKGRRGSRFNWQG